MLYAGRAFCPCGGVTTSRAGGIFQIYYGQVELSYLSIVLLLRARMPMSAVALVFSYE